MAPRPTKERSDTVHVVQFELYEEKIPLGNGPTCPFYSVDDPHLLKPGKGSSFGHLSLLFLVSLLSTKS